MYKRQVQGCINGVGEELHMIYSKNAFGFDPEFRGIEQDLDKAREYLEAAGYADGFEFTAYVQESGTYFKMAEVLQGASRSVMMIDETDTDAFGMQIVEVHGEYTLANTDEHRLCVPIDGDVKLTTPQESVTLTQGWGCLLYTSRCV